MVFQLLNNIKFTLALRLEPEDTSLVVLDSDLTDAQKYDPNKILSLTLVGDEELNEYEIVYATSRTGTTFEITRGEETTMAAIWPAGTQIIAALTSGVLEGTIAAPGDATDITYGGGNFGSAGDLESTIDDMGDAIISLAANSDPYEFTQQRVGGGLFSGGVADATNLRWQGSAKKFVTAGLGVVVTTTCTIAEPAVKPDLMLALRCADVSNFGTITVVAYNNAAPTNYMSWSIAKTQLPVNNAWLLAFMPASSATIGGTPDTELPDRVKVEFKDDSTGPFEVSINHLDVLRTRESYLGSFIRVLNNSDFDKVNTIAKYGFQVSMILNIEDLAALDQVRLTRADLDGHRFFLTSTANFKAQDANQVMVKLYTGQREMFNRGLVPHGWVYQGGYNGPLDLDLNTSIRRLVSLVYPRAVGVGTFRSAIEVYWFDDPLKVEANLTAAQGDLTGSDKRAINVDLSALTVANLDTLYAGIISTKNFYTTTLDYQNADNLKSGTVDVARLPTIPYSKGGTGASTPEGAMINIGCPVGTVLPFAGSVVPTGWTLCDGRLLTNATYPKLYAALGSASNPFGISGAQFRVPDLRGFVVAGRDNMGSGAAGRLTNVGTTMGAVGGAQNHTLTVAQMPSHAHTGGTGGQSANHTHTQQGTFSSDADGAHSHTMKVYGGQGADTALPNASGDTNLIGTASSAALSTAATHDHRTTISGQTGINSAGHTHGITAEGGNATHNNTQLTMVLNWIIRTI
jgi:microcystin-dependent protein